MTTQLNAESIQRFMKGQVSAWNAHDREAFLDCYHQIAPESLVIEYAGRTDTRDGWFILEEMFDQHNADISLEVVETIYNGNDVAAHHRNCLNGTGLAIESIETYRFSPGKLQVCYFLKPPVTDNLDLTQFRGFASA
ncbi:nuclear transport factor 2 family protein [Stutzerimonas xanthomarina]|uniref:nuclear transport factor 2 family protein n=1 Tax=Stutzerimonas xanthomarina TaxID=271420 RepID=UPI003AA8EADB